VELSRVDQVADHLRHVDFHGPFFLALIALGDDDLLQLDRCLLPENGGQALRVLPIQLPPRRDDVHVLISMSLVVVGEMAT
jgi:hypothetical protein